MKILYVRTQGFPIIDKLSSFEYHEVNSLDEAVESLKKDKFEGIIFNTSDEEIKKTISDVAKSLEEAPIIVNF